MKKPSDAERLHIPESLMSNAEMMTLIGVAKNQVRNLMTPFNSQVMTLELLLVLAYRQGFFDALIAEKVLDESILAREQAREGEKK